MIYVLAPVYNEEKNIETLYQNVIKTFLSANIADYRFIFVNDGSTDKSLEILAALAKNNDKVIVLSHYPNKGVKTTFIEGFKEFLKCGNSGDILITIEADNTFDEANILPMINAISSGQADVVLSSCYAPGGSLEKTSLWRKFISSIANNMVRLRFNLWRYYTLSSFNRAFSYDCLKKIFQLEKPMTLDGFVCVVEMLIKLHRNKFKIIEIPMTLRTSRRRGKSKMPFLKTVFNYFYLCFLAKL